MCEPTNNQYPPSLLIPDVPFFVLRLGRHRAEYDPLESIDINLYCKKESYDPAHDVRVVSPPATPGGICKKKNTPDYRITNSYYIERNGSITAEDKRKFTKNSSYRKHFILLWVGGLHGN